MGETVIISQEEYRELLAIKERVECTKRLAEKTPYLSVSSICVILDIDIPTAEPKGDLSFKKMLEDA